MNGETELIETLAKWKADGLFQGEFLDVESEHSVLSAAIASEATGVRTFTASSSQGLALMHEMFYVASGMRMPLVMINASRGLSAPITLWSDHNDILSTRDTGWIIFFAETNQELLDLTIQAFKIAENGRVLLPTIVNMDGFILSYTREPVSLPDQVLVDEFLPRFNPRTYLDPIAPMNLGVPVMDEYMGFRLQQQKAMENAEEVAKSSFKDWNTKFGRRYNVIEEFMMDDANLALVSVGAMTSTVKTAVLEARRRGIKVGLAKLLSYRPFPAKDLQRVLEKVGAIAVCDQNLAPGFGGIIFPEIKSALYDSKKIINDYIVGLGGKPAFLHNYLEIIEDIEKSAKEGKGNRVKYVVGD